MGIVIIDNVVQLAVTAGCGIYSAVLFIRRKEQAWFLLTCFYGAFSLGLINWTLFIWFRAAAPQFFSVSDLNWIAGGLFLLALQTTIRLPGEGAYRPLWAWAVPVFCAVMSLYFFQYSAHLLDILWTVPLGGCGYFALRGLLFARRQSAQARGTQYFHMVVLIYILLEHCLWVASCDWKGDTLSNPYFWFDFLLTATYFSFLPALKRAVAK